MSIDMKIIILNNNNYKALNFKYLNFNKKEKMQQKKVSSVNKEF